jgi:hypothetical protein
MYPKFQDDSFLKNITFGLALGYVFRIFWIWNLDFLNLGIQIFKYEIFEKKNKNLKSKKSKKILFGFFRFKFFQTQIIWIWIPKSEIPRFKLFQTQIIWIWRISKNLSFKNISKIPNMINLNLNLVPTGCFHFFEYFKIICLMGVTSPFWFIELYYFLFHLGIGIHPLTKHKS